MSDYTRRNEADDLRAMLNRCHDYTAELEEKCGDMTERLREAERAVEHNRNTVDEEQYKGELRYRDGMIDGLEFAIVAMTKK